MKRRNVVHPDISSKVISSIRRFVDYDISSMRRLGDYDVWSATTYRLKFVELRRNSSNFSRNRTGTNFFGFVFFFYHLHLKSAVLHNVYD